MASSLAPRPCAWPCAEPEALVALEAVMARMSRRCRHRQNQIQAQECRCRHRQNQMQVREPARASLVVQVLQLAAVAQVPLVVQVPLAAMEPHTQQERRR